MLQIVDPEFSNFKKTKLLEKLLKDNIGYEENEIKEVLKTEEEVKKEQEQQEGTEGEFEQSEEQQTDEHENNETPVE